MLPVAFMASHWLTPQQDGNDSVEEELGLVGASAEDTEAELIRKICESELLAGKPGSPM